MIGIDLGRVLGSVELSRGPRGLGVLTHCSREHAATSRGRMIDGLDSLELEMTLRVRLVLVFLARMSLA